MILGFMIFFMRKLKAGGKPSTWFPPGGTRRAGFSPLLFRMWKSKKLQQSSLIFRARESKSKWKHKNPKKNKKSNHNSEYKSGSKSKLHRHSINIHWHQNQTICIILCRPNPNPTPNSISTPQILDPRDLPNHEINANIQKKIEISFESRKKINSSPAESIEIYLNLLKIMKSTQTYLNSCAYI